MRTRVALFLLQCLAQIYNFLVQLALLKQKEEIEQQIDTLKYQKAAMQLNDYRFQLQGLLTQLAKLQAELDK